MIRLSVTGLATAAVLIAVIALAAGRSDVARANDIVDAGYDLLETGDPTSIDFTSIPIPADFFGPGSDPFTGTVPLEGVPLDSYDPGTGPIGGLEPTDTIVERLQDAGTGGFPDTIDIEIVELSLKSVAPITVSVNGGASFEDWDIDVVVPENDINQTTGTMTIRHDTPGGGTFDSVLPVDPLLTFTRISGGPTTTAGPLYLSSITGGALDFQATDENWCHTANPLNSPSGQIVIENSLTSNFFPGINCAADPDVMDKALFTLDAGDAVHSVQPAEKYVAVPVNAGHDLLETGDPTSIDHSTVPIPADFFGPGSDPFTGTVPLEGVPIPDYDPGAGPIGGLESTDTIVERLQDAGTLGFPDTIDIEIVELSLKSVAPITVTFNGGQNPESWDLDVVVPENDPNQVTGTMTVRHETTGGGTFDALLPVKPVLTFTKVDPPNQGIQMVLDWHAEALPPLDFIATDENWCHTANPLATPPNQIVIENSLTSNFFPGITCTPDLNVRNKALFTLDAGAALHSVQPAETEVPVGGIADFPDDEVSPLSASDPSSGSSLPYAAAVGGLAAFVAIVAGGWYARRRWVR